MAGKGSGRAVALPSEKNYAKALVLLPTERLLPRHFLARSYMPECSRSRLKVLRTMGFPIEKQCVWEDSFERRQYTSLDRATYAQYNDLAIQASLTRAILVASGKIDAYKSRARWVTLARPGRSNNVAEKGSRASFNKQPPQRKATTVVKKQSLDHFIFPTKEVVENLLLLRSKARVRGRGFLNVIVRMPRLRRNLRKPNYLLSLFRTKVVEVEFLRLCRFSLLPTGTAE